MNNIDFIVIVYHVQRSGRKRFTTEDSKFRFYFIQVLRSCSHHLQLLLKPKHRHSLYSCLSKLTAAFFWNNYSENVFNAVYYRNVYIIIQGSCYAQFQGHLNIGSWLTLLDVTKPSTISFSFALHFPAKWPALAWRFIYGFSSYRTKSHPREATNEALSEAPSETPSETPSKAPSQVSSSVSVEDPSQDPSQDFHYKDSGGPSNTRTGRDKDNIFFQRLISVQHICATVWSYHQNPCHFSSIWCTTNIHPRTFIIIRLTMIKQH